MSNLLDLKKWALDSSDEKCATLRHEKGHTMKIALKALPAIQREQIKRLAKSASTQHFAEGTPDEPITAPDPAPAPTPSDSSDTTSAPAGTNITINAAPAAPVPAVAPMAMPAAPIAPSAGGTNAPARGLAGEPQAAPSAPDIQGQGQSAVNLQAQGIREQQGVDAEKAKAAAINEDAYIKQRQQLQQLDQKNFQELKNHTDEFRDYTAKNPINAKSYQENMGTGQKMATGLGLLLGGFKQGAFGGNNPAADFLNKQIDRDIDAQKARSEQQKTVYGAYQHLYGDSVIATNLAKVSANDILAHQAQLAAAKLGTPQAKAAADKLAAEKSIENIQLLGVSASRLSGLKTGSIKATGGNGGSAGAAGKPGGGGEMTEGAKRVKSWTEGGDEKQPKKKQPAAELDAITPILHPGAENLYKGLQYTPKAKDQMGDISRQFSQAVQADKALAQLPRVFDNLVKGSEKAGVSGRIHAGINPHAVAGALGGVGAGIGMLMGGPGAAAGGAGIGASLGEGLGHVGKAVTNTDELRSMDSDKSQLVGMINGALRGTNIGSAQIQEVVDANTPVYGDSDATLMKKRQNIAEFIKSHTETSLLKTWHLSGE